MNIAEYVLTIVVPLSTALVSAASVYFVFTKVGIPYAGSITGIIFLLTFMQSWGKKEVEL